MGGDAAETARADRPIRRTTGCGPWATARGHPGLHAFPFSRARRQALGLRVALAPLRRRRLRRAATRTHEHRLPLRGQGLRRPRGPGERQLRLPHGLRPRLPERGGARRGHRLGQVVPRHDRGRRLPPRRGQAHLGLVLPGVARRHGEARGEGPVRGGRVLDPGRGEPCTGTSTAWRGRVHVFDVPLHYALPRRGPGAAASYDMRRILDRDAGAAARQRGRDLRRQPRLAAAARPWSPRSSPGSSPWPTPSSCCGGRATRASSTPTTTGPSTRTTAGTAGPPSDCPRTAS